MSLRILIVDDEPDVIEFQKSYLSRRKYIVDTAKNTREAIDMISRNSPDVVFCDIRLDTDTSGLDILEQAKKIKPDIVIYLVTGIIDREIEARGIALGAKEILTKPLPNEILEKKINAV
ncbi:MAG: response regulator [Candidatus Omnitrophica bacterium]|nr:response regulator [Candidatus Omnitrophota bacterium]